MLFYKPILSTITWRRDAEFRFISPRVRAVASGRRVVMPGLPNATSYSDCKKLVLSYHSSGLCGCH